MIQGSRKIREKWAIRWKIKIRRVFIFVATFFLFISTFYFVNAATNISSVVSEHWAWNSIISWIGFYETNTVTVTSQKIEGYASSSVGDISLDCATTRSGNICSASNGNYTVVNDGNGNLSGWGWNDAIGWVSFYCGNHGGCGASPYRVLISPTNGEFSGYAWNEVVGWMSFNCADYDPPAPCSPSNYDVETSWTANSTSGIVISSTFDTGISGGAQINSVLWQGSQPAGTTVRFQFATTNASSGPWSYVGSDGTSNSYYTVDANVSVGVNYVLHNNARYFRYKIELVSDTAQTMSPRVDDVIINWSP